MQGIHTHQPKLFVSVTLDDLVPEDNFYHRLDVTLDLSILSSETRGYYEQEGQVSIDPLVFFKLLMIGYLNNLTSDRHLDTYASNCLDVCWFLGYQLDKTLPWHSTISLIRTQCSGQTGSAGGSGKGVGRRIR